MKRRKKESGQAGRKRRKREGMAVAASGVGSLVEVFAKLGPPPEDPVQAIVWCNRASALAAWCYATMALSEADRVRLRGLLDAVRANGMTNSKAVDKERLRRIEKRLGMTDEKDGNELEECPDGDPPALRA